MTRSLGSTTLNAPYPPVGLQSSTSFSSSTSAQPQTRQTSYPSSNAPTLLPPLMSNKYPELSDNSGHPRQWYTSSDINPQYFAPGQFGGQQPYHLGSDAGLGSRLPSIAGGVSEGFSNYQHADQPPPYVHPYTQAPAQALDSQSGYGSQQTEEKVIDQIGDDKFDSMSNYLPEAEMPKCNNHMPHQVGPYGAPGLPNRRPSLHALANYGAWKKQALDKQNLNASTSSSSPSEGSDQPKPQRRRLDNDRSHQ